SCSFHWRISRSCRSAMSQPSYTSPPWPRNLKTIAAVAFLVLAALVFWRFFEFVQLFVLAALAAFILHPILALFNRRFKVPRGVAVFITYVLFVLIVSALALIVGTLVRDQVTGLIDNILETVSGVSQFTQESLANLSNATVQIGRFYLQVPTEQLNSVLDQFAASLVSQV